MQLMQQTLHISQKLESAQSEALVHKEARPGGSFVRYGVASQ